MTSSAPHSDNDHPAEAAPRKRSGRPRGSRISYAALYRNLLPRVRHARDLLLEAADADPAVCKALLNVALRTLSEE